MKYKKLLVFITCLLFVTVAVFCLASAFKVTDIELNVTVVEGSDEGVTAKCEQELLKYKDKNLLFVNTDKIGESLSDLSGYVDVVEVKKVFPNKLSISVNERVEAFSIFNGEKYYALDKAFNVLSEKQSLKNNVSGIDNVEIKLSLSDFSTDVKVGKKLEIYDDNTFTYLTLCADKLYEIKDSLKSVTVTVKKEGISYKAITLEMKEGVVFTLLKADENTVEKLNATYEFYLALENKGAGKYITVLEDNGNISIKQ